jgi:lipocalin
VISLDATYGINPNNTVSVLNQCNNFSPSGAAGGISGYAYPEPDNAAKLNVVFFGQKPLYPNYWIMNLGPINSAGQYSWALVGIETRKY